MTNQRTNRRELNFWTLNTMFVKNPIGYNTYKEDIGNHDSGNLARYFDKWNCIWITFDVLLLVLYLKKKNKIKKK